MVVGVVGVAVACKTQAPEVRQPVEPVSASDSATEFPPRKTVAEESVQGGADQAQLVAALLSHEALKTYLHPELPERLPVVLRPSTLVPKSLSVEAYGQPVRVVDDSNALLLEWVQRSNGSARVRLSYPLEGVIGQAELERVKQKWSVVRVDISET